MRGGGGEPEVEKKSELSQEAETESVRPVLSFSISLARALFATSSPLAMSQLTNSARTSFSASMGSLGGAAT